MQQTIDELRSTFSCPGLDFEQGHGSLTKATVTTSNATGELYLHGAHVTGFQVPGQKPVLWMSKKSLFESGKAIRGGVPICFPWFGPNAADPKAPSHGYARTKPWRFASAVASADGNLTLELQTEINDFAAAFFVTFGKALEMKLQITLLSSASGPARYEAALHTYLGVSDIRSVSIVGLETTDYIDKVDSGKIKPASGAAIRFSGECDRVYLDTTATCLLKDPGFARTISVSKFGSHSTIVWNPSIEKSAKMADFGDDEWQGMVCIESANVASNSIELRTGESHTMAATISVSS